MLVELAVADLGVLADLSLVLGPGMTALTGETGAGKTLVVTAVELLTGGRADTAMVRPGAAEARIEGRFVDAGGEEVVLTRVVPAEGRSRAYVDGRLAPVSALAERGSALVDLHGQSAHQALLTTAAQRAALDAAGGVDLDPLRAARARVAELDAALAALGGDAGARTREVDYLRFTVAELDRAALDDPDEEERLEAEEEALSDAAGTRAASEAARAALVDEGGAGDALGTARSALRGRATFADVEARLAAVAAEVDEAAADLRALAEAVDDDPGALEAVQARRALLTDLRRKHAGRTGTLADVLAAAEQARTRLADLESADVRAEALEAERSAALATERKAAAKVGKKRRSAAPRLAADVTRALRELAMPRAEIHIEVGADDPGDDVTFLLAANPGERALPLARVASGGELARTMLALRLVLGGGATGPGRTLVFDEVDAGVGGEAALAVGRALAAVAATAQVLVVTHRPQVAAFAGAQVAVRKDEVKGRTVAGAAVLEEPDRVVELSRMLSGHPDSRAARGHAEELLAAARRGSA
jgi:DNA repair protein RecN (Recombination protein N)